MAGQFFANNCSVGIFLVANLEILAWKYKTPRNYRVIFLEAGHFSQTLQLVATSKDVNTWITGAFNDTIIEKTCRLDGVKKIPTFFVGLGRGEYRSMHSIMAKKLKECVGDDKV
ncbi:MAG: SagB/ThcOx family dehydrogenase [Bergeyella sp.]|nr:SagB/ThcOx family dehydrogenase [Bergeyella sp.]